MPAHTEIVREERGDEADSESESERARERESDRPTDRPTDTQTDSEFVIKSELRHAGSHVRSRAFSGHTGCRVGVGRRLALQSAVHRYTESCTGKRIRVLTPLLPGLDRLHPQPVFLLPLPPLLHLPELAHLGGSLRAPAAFSSKSNSKASGKGLAFCRLRRFRSFFEGDLSQKKQDGYSRRLPVIAHFEYKTA